jgi:hypothetical protein
MTARSTIAAVLTVTFLAALAARPAQAVPIFAERYGFSCAQCHTAVPDLNAFGNAFRKAGYRLPKVPTHREFPFAIRFQNTWTKDLLPSQTRRFNNLLVLISTADFGRNHEYSYFTRYLIGSQGAAGSLYYLFGQHVDDRGRVARLGLFGLETIEQVTQRNDTITAPIAYTESVGHSSANLTTPRLGAMIGERNDREDLSLVVVRSRAVVHAPGGLRHGHLPARTGVEGRRPRPQRRTHVHLALERLDFRRHLLPRRAAGRMVVRPV